LKLNHFIVAVAALTAIGGGVHAADAPRAARSVHLGYSAPAGDLFYTEMVIEQSVNGSYFMACGWDTGYFGLQQLNHPTNKVVIFSVWDPTKGDDPKAVKTEDRVENLFSGEGVRIKRFGGEGTGGQSMAPFAWQLGETNRFLIRSQIESNKTSYTAWIFDSARSDWRKLATFRTRTGGRDLRGYYSFVEDFRRDKRSVDEVRRARFGNGWVRKGGNEWVSLTTARFTASSASWESKENIDAGISDNWFYLATGGATQRTTELRSTLRRPEQPSEAKPPKLPF
jgi:hypothetical protein